MRLLQPLILIPLQLDFKFNLKHQKTSTVNFIIDCFNQIFYLILVKYLGK
jgi:hypothetical protein